MSAAEQYAATIRDARAVAHRAVTEGVNLKYVDVLRRTTYELADLAAALLEQQQQRDDQVKELEASAEALARDDDDDPNEWARKFVDNELSWHEHGDDLREGARHLVDALALAVRAERLQAEAEAAYAAELGLRLATERLLDEATEHVRRLKQYLSTSSLDLATVSVWREADDWLARLGAAAPQQEPATSGDNGLNAVVSEETRPL